MKNKRLLLNMVVMLSIYNIFLIYIVWNVWTWLDVSFKFPYPAIVSIIILFLAYSFLLGQVNKKVSILKALGGIWFGIFQYLLLLLPFANLVVFFLQRTIPKETAITITGAVFSTMVIFIFVFGLRQAYSPVVRNYSFTVKKKTNRKQLRIAVASDMHFGMLSGKRHLKRLVSTVKKVNPDIILLPGDIVDDDPTEFLNKKMDVIMKDLKAPLGTYGVLGNHEYYGKAIPKFVEVMESIGITILMDDIITINNCFLVVGRKDRTDIKRQSMEEITMNLDKTLPIIMMDHQPYELEQAMECGVDVILSGHTHRGQLAPNHFITRKIFELDWGYKQKDQLHAIVSSGFGFWGPPLRIGSRSEVVQIDITFE